MNLSIRTLTEADLDSADGILQSAFGSPFSRKAELGGDLNAMKSADASHFICHSA